MNEQLSLHGRRLLDRRSFIGTAGLSAAGLALANMLNADGLLAKEAPKTVSGTAPIRPDIDPNNPYAPRAPHFDVPAKKVLVIFCPGAVSHVDTFDYKPELQKYANKSLPQDKKYINSGGRRVGFLTPNWRPFRPGGQSGLLVSDYFPNVRRHADKLAVLKACHADSHAHGSALVAMNTGSTFIGRPSLGAWSVYGLGTENQSLPGYVVMLDKRGGPISGQPNWSSGFMPSTFQGTLFRPSGNPILDLKGPAHLDAKAQRRQLDLLAKLNQKHLDERPGGQELAARIQSYELAYRMQSEAPEAVDLSREKQATRDLYGIGQQPTDEYGRNCLIARRLVERGVRFIQLYSGGGHLEDTWDGHESIEKNHGLHGAEVDQPIAALLTDLEQRGLLDSTLVVWGGEFGRTPMAQGSGRDHHPHGFTMWLAGGGVRPGIIHGATDEFGYFAADNRVHVHDFNATLLHLLGLDHEKLTYRHAGRDFRLTDVHGHVVKQLVG